MEGRSKIREANNNLVVDVESRKLHTYVTGLHGTGKSTLLGNIILRGLTRSLEDQSQAEGLCLLDPHGDLIEDILLCIPPQRIGDVILFDPSNTDYPFGLNLFECPDPTQKDLVCLNNQGPVLSRKFLMKKVRNTDYLDDTRVLDVYICHLRRKIEEDSHKPRRLHTVRGVGYRFGE